MKKETLLAITLGIITGVVIAASIITSSRKESPKKSTSTPSPSIIPTISIKKESIIPLSIIKPKDQTVTENSSITISGTGSKDSLVVIHSLYDQKVFRLAKSGFETSFSLGEGYNEIKITMYNKQDVDVRTLIMYKNTPSS